MNSKRRKNKLTIFNHKRWNTKTYFEINLKENILKIQMLYFYSPKPIVSFCVDR